MHHGDFLTSMGVETPEQPNNSKKSSVVVAKPAAAPTKSTVLFREMGLGYYYSNMHL